MSHLQRMYASSAIPRLQTCHCAQEELSSLGLEMDQVVWSEVIEYLEERGSVGLQEEELAPETLRLFALEIDIILTRGRGHQSARHVKYRSTNSCDGAASLTYLGIASSVFASLYCLAWGGGGRVSFRTWNKASYSFTIFCWNISGRACWVRGEASIMAWARVWA